MNRLWFNELSKIALKYGWKATPHGDFGTIEIPVSRYTVCGNFCYSVNIILNSQSPTDFTSESEFINHVLSVVSLESYNAGICTGKQEIRDGIKDILSGKNDEL